MPTDDDSHRIRSEAGAGSGADCGRPSRRGIVSLAESSLISPRISDALATIHQQTLELIVRGASLQDVLGALCDGIDALDPDLISSVLLADPNGQQLWPAAGRRVPEDYKQLITVIVLEG